MKLKAIRKESRLDVRLYRRQCQKLDKFCEINNISPSQLIRNFVEDLEVIERTVTSGPLQKTPEGNPQRLQSGGYHDN